MTDAHSLAHTRWEGPCGVDPQISPQGTVWNDPAGVRRGAATTGATEGVRDSGREADARPGPYADQHSPQICSLASDRVSQGQERHP